MSSVYGDQGLKLIINIPGSVVDAKAEIKPRIKYAKVNSKLAAGLNIFKEPGHQVCPIDCQDYRRAGLSMKRAIRDSHYYSEWFDYILKKNFDSICSENTSKFDSLMQKFDLKVNREKFICYVIGRGYEWLSGQSKLNLAKLKDGCMDKLIKSGKSLDYKLWQEQLERPEYMLSMKTKNNKEFKCFFDRLTKYNQEQLRMALFFKSFKSSQNFLEFTSLFNDLTSDLIDRLLMMDSNLGNLNKFYKQISIDSNMNLLSKESRMAFLCSKSFQKYKFESDKSKLMGFVLGKDFKTSDFNIKDFLSLVKLIESLVLAEDNLDKLVNKLSIPLIGSYQKTLDQAGSDDFVKLYKKNESFRTVIQNCALKKRYHDKVINFNVTEDIVRGEDEPLVLPASDYNQLILAAEELESKNKNLAMLTYCEAMEKQDQLDPVVLDKAYALAASSEEGSYLGLAGLFEKHFEKYFEKHFEKELADITDITDVKLKSNVEKLHTISQRCKNYQMLVNKCPGEEDKVYIPEKIYNQLVNFTELLKGSYGVDSLARIKDSWELLLENLPMRDEKYFEIMLRIADCKIALNRIRSNDAEGVFQGFDNKVFNSEDDKVKVALSKIYLALQQDPNSKLNNCFKFKDHSILCCLTVSNHKEDTVVRARIENLFRDVPNFCLANLNSKVKPFKFTLENIKQVRTKLFPMPSIDGSRARICSGAILSLGSVAALATLAATGVLATFAAPAILGIVAIGVIGGYLIKTGLSNLNLAKTQEISQGDDYVTLGESSCSGSTTFGGVAKRPDGPSAPPCPGVLMAIPVPSDGSVPVVSDMDLKFS